MRSPKRTEARDGRSERPDSRRSRHQPLRMSTRNRTGGLGFGGAQGFYYRAVGFQQTSFEQAVD
jgi:hypothetical protein